MDKSNKYLYFTLIGLSFSVITHSQTGPAADSSKIDGPTFVSEAFALYPMYIQVQQHNNTFNYGFGAYAGLTYRSFRFTTGLYYNTRKYSFEYHSVGQYEKVVIHAEHYSIPVLIDIFLHKRKYAFQTSLTIGVVGNLPFNYHEDFFTASGAPSQPSRIPSSYDSGIAGRLGFQYNTRIQHRLFATFKVFGDVRWRLAYVEFQSGGPHPGKNYAEGDRIFAGLSAGLRYDFVPLKETARHNFEKK